MKLKYFILLFTGTIALSVTKAQTKSDSIAVTKRFKELLAICKNVNFKDPKTLSTGLFYKAAPYIIYRGDDKKREWKDFANYSNPKEKEGVDEVCLRINETVNRDSSYIIEKYLTQTESEGKWHMLMISFVKKGVNKKAVFAFLKVKNQFGVGDID